MSYLKPVQADHFQGGANLSQAEGGRGPDLGELMRGMEGPALKEQHKFLQLGTITAATGVGGAVIAPFAGKVTRVRTHVKVCGTATATTVDVNVRGTSVFAAAGDRPTTDNAEADGTTKSVPPTAATDVISFAAGDVITMDVDAAPTAGSDLTVIVELDYDA